ncbi:hypothetical protein Acr_18g0007840 [Actinidia rufa]|uniref:Uncharacterized protein n=1 Tax=Actinidia rufa TaxID=165716 RepID=A0A7J0G736_9ERIC|nr:hypothetical protein Acr_18g0007840 [Actinidia rufa]
MGPSSAQPLPAHAMSSSWLPTELSCHNSVWGDVRPHTHVAQLGRIGSSVRQHGWDTVACLFGSTRVWLSTLLHRTHVWRSVWLLSHVWICSLFGPVHVGRCSAARIAWLLGRTWNLAPEFEHKDDRPNLLSCGSYSLYPTMPGPNKDQLETNVWTELPLSDHAWTNPPWNVLLWIALNLP